MANAFSAGFSLENVNLNKVGYFLQGALDGNIEFFNDECLSTMYAGKLPEEGF